MSASRARRRPVIGIPVGRHLPKHPEFVRLRQTYTRAVSAAGGAPILIPPIDDPDAIEEVVGLVDGLLFPGGLDVETERYTDEPRHATVVADPVLDDLELAVARLAVEREIPTLGICRGQQLLNVALGGTLIQDIPSALGVAHPQSGAEDRARVAHPIRVAPDSRLAAVLGATELGVNSHHHQAVKRLGRGLRAVGWSPDDGVVEAIESTEHPWLLCIQFHPEDMVGGDSLGSEAGRRLFRAFVAACAERAGLGLAAV